MNEGDRITISLGRAEVDALASFYQSLAVLVDAQSFVNEVRAPFLIPQHERTYREVFVLPDTARVEIKHMISLAVLADSLNEELVLQGLNERIEGKSRMTRESWLDLYECLLSLIISSR